MTENPDFTSPGEEPAATDGQDLSIARQAIVDEERAVFGYELFDRSRAAGTHTADSDAVMLFNLLSHVNVQALMGKKTVFVNCMHESLEDGHLDLVQAERVVIYLRDEYPEAHAILTRELARLPAGGWHLLPRLREVIADSGFSKRFVEWVRRVCRWTVTTTITTATKGAGKGEEGR